jgi:predicted metal-dependent peptidase
MDWRTLLRRYVGQALEVRPTLHVALLSRLQVTTRESIDTMAVRTEGEQLTLLYNPTFVLDISLAELVGVLLHEVLHVLFGHLSMASEDYPNSAARTIAQEVTVNEYIAEPLPGEPVQLEQYPMLPPGESTEERYRRLETIIPEVQAVETLDNHEQWSDTDNVQAIRQAIEDAIVLAGPENVPEELRQALAGQGIGTEAGQQLESIDRGRRGSMDWRTLLRRYVGQALEVRPTFARLSRRFPDLAGIVPGQARQTCRPKIMAVIDTSASISRELLTRIDGELRRLAKSNGILIVECDVCIHRIYSYDLEDGLHAVQGRGGTDLRPPFQCVFLREHRPDLIIYFTDGCGSAPERKPHVPVIWCLTPEGESPTSWGRSVHMQAADVRNI